MDAKHLQARDHIIKAREALHRGDKDSARGFGEQAALLAPDMEDAWLVLATSEPDPQDALAYARKALELKPDSTRAHQAVEWASKHAKQAPAGKDAPRPETKVQKDAATSLPRFVPQHADPQPEVKPKKRTWFYVGFLGLLVCVIFAIAAWSAFSSPVFASIINSAPAPTQENLWAAVNVPKPSVTPIDVSVFAMPALADTPTPEPTDAPTVTPTEIPTEAPEILPTDTQNVVPTDVPTTAPEVTETPGVMAMEIVPNTPTSVYVPPSGPKPVVASNGGGWIDVDLTNQRVNVYEGETLINSFLVSTGTWLTPTVTGQYKIYVKYRSTNMSGPGYYLPDVPYVMYFYKGYGLHGTYWHSNFGTPMSHGCVNLATSDAKWLYNWASVGTVVNVHY